MVASKETPPHLSFANVTRLRRDPSPSTRAETAAGVAAVFAHGGLTDQERHYAIDIIERFAGDVEDQVREAVSEHVKHCPFLPSGIAVKLAHDVESVALPIIRYSEVLTDDDLIAIVREGCTIKQITVASRAKVATSVAGALVCTGKKNVVGTLLGNQGADIDDAAYIQVATNFAQDHDIHALLIDRPTLPASVSARLITCMSEALRERLVERHGFPPVLADEIVMHGRDRAVTMAIEPNTSRDEVERLLDALRATHGLSPTFLLRALTKGDLAFFESSLATIARLPQESVSHLIRDRGMLGFQSLYTRADLPPQLFAAFRTALDVVLEVRAERPYGWTDQDTKRIVGGLVRSYDDICPGNIENVLSRLARRAATPAHTTHTNPAIVPNRRWNDPPSKHATAIVA
ncbi:MAG: DUF2336 domain-containing protein [Alphaproteobacteria bacterium]